MKCFFVIAREDAEITENTISNVFPKHYVVIRDSVWAVAHPDMFSTTQDVCKSLGIGQEGGKAGIVLPAEGYNGYFDSALWEALAQWRSIA